VGRGVLAGEVGLGLLSGSLPPIIGERIGERIGARIGIEGMGKGSLMSCGSRASMVLSTTERPTRFLRMVFILINCISRMRRD
jgi:hypothetical protein